MARQAAEFATPRPEYWRAYAAEASRDFGAYLAFVKGHIPAPHHEIIIERLLYGDTLELILGPPDSAKTTVCLSWLEWEFGRNPNLRALVISEIAAGIATTIVTQIGDTIASNERYHMAFGHLQDPSGRSVWSTYTLRFRTYVSQAQAAQMRQPPTPPPPFPWLSPRGRRADLAHPNCKASGWRGGYTGFRADVILIDDIVSEKSSRSQVVTEEAHRTLHQKILARLTGPNPRVVMCGQRWAPRDLFGMILDRATVVHDSNPDREGLWVLDRDAPVNGAA